VAEAEFAFRLGADLPPRGAPYDVAACLDAVASLHPAIEIPDSRYRDFATAGALQLIADLACGHYFVLGAAATADWRAIDLAAHPVVATVSDGPPRHGIGANVLGDPRVALAWLVNEVSALGITLRAGQVITTGTCVTPVPIAPGQHVRCDFGVLGTVGVQLV
jgi:2-keto-4-pentenoate hydratase